VIMPPRILLAGPEWVAGWTESTARALGQLGCTVEVFYYIRTGVTRQVQLGRKWLATLLGREKKVTSPWIRKLYWRWTGVRAGSSLIVAAREFSPDVVLVLKGEILKPRTLALLRQGTGASLAAWWVDDPFAMERQDGWRNAVTCLPLYDHVFVFDKQYFSPLKKRGVKRLTFLPCAADPEFYRPQDIADSERGAYAATVSLVGMYYENRGRVVEQLLDEPGLRVWGTGWEWFFNNRLGKAGRTRVGGDVLRPDEVSKVYSSSVVNLNTHHPQSQNGGLNSRAFEIPAAGAFQLTDYVNGMEELLEPGREVAVYMTPQQVPELVRRYINDPDSRNRTARAGYERVLAQHTYRHRMATILSSL